MLSLSKIDTRWHAIIILMILHMDSGGKFGIQFNQDITNYQSETNDIGMSLVEMMTHMCTYQQPTVTWTCAPTNSLQ